MTVAASSCWPVLPEVHALSQRGMAIWRVPALSPNDAALPSAKHARLVNLRLGLLQGG